MTECSSCGAELAHYETRCPFCNKPTAYYHRQRRCLHCGAAVAQKAETCMLCGRPVDNLPLRASFSGSWLGIILGVMIIVGLVMWVNTPPPDQEVAQVTPSPTLTATPWRTPTPTATATSTPLPQVVIVPTPTPRTHTVESGQTLSYIARQYQVTIEDIVALNKLPDSSTLKVGQVLLIPGSAATPAGGDTLPPQIVHVIQSGETISGLAEQYDTPLDAIIAANPGLNVDLVYAGQEVIIPLAMPTATLTPTPLPTATPTPGPRYLAPALLSPASGEVAAGAMIWFNWTAPGFLADDEFYVLQLTWPNGARRDYWTKTTGWRVPKTQRAAAGPVTWSVAIMRQTGADDDGVPFGLSLSAPGEQRTFLWPD